jgi:hypothetical protein
MENPKLEFSSTFLTAIAVMKAELSKLTNKEAKEVLTMLSSIRNLRIVAMDRPIGRPIAESGGGPDTGPSPKGRKNSQPSAPWKADPRWKSAIADHSKLVTSLKTETDAIAKASLLVLLRDSELALKALKRELQGHSFHRSA